MSRKIDHKIPEKNGWDLAIAEGEVQLKKWKSKVAKLIASIETFREAKKSGRSWPSHSGPHS